MTLREVLAKIHAPKGVTSLVAGVMSGDFGPIRKQSAVGVSLDEARAKLARVEQAQRDCQSDWAYWGYMGDIAYWRAVVDILTAADLVGPDNLADVPAPTGVVVMDLCAATERYGRAILAAARRQQEDRDGRD